MKKNSFFKVILKKKIKKQFKMFKIPKTCTVRGKLGSVLAPVTPGVTGVVRL